MHSTSVGSYTIHHNGDFSGELIVQGLTDDEIRVGFAYAVDVVMERLGQAVREAAASDPSLADAARWSQQLSPVALLESLINDERVRLNSFSMPDPNDEHYQRNAGPNRTAEQYIMDLYGGEVGKAILDEDGRTVRFEKTDETVPLSVLAQVVCEAIIGEMYSPAEYDDSTVAGLSVSDFENFDDYSEILTALVGEGVDVSWAVHVESAEEIAYEERKAQIARDADAVRMFSVRASYSTISDEDIAAAREAFERLADGAVRPQTA